MALFCHPFKLFEFNGLVRNYCWQWLVKWALRRFVWGCWSFGDDVWHIIWKVDDFAAVLRSIHEALARNVQVWTIKLEWCVDWGVSMTSRSIWTSALHWFQLIYLRPRVKFLCGQSLIDALDFLSHVLWVLKAISELHLAWDSSWMLKLQSFLQTCW